MSAGSDIAREVKAALAEAAEAVGSGPLIGRLRRKGAQTGPDYAPVYWPDTYHEFNVLLDSFSAQERLDTNIAPTDTKILCGVGDVVPEVFEQINISGINYKIHGVFPLMPAGEILLYELWARGSDE